MKLIIDGVNANTENKFIEICKSNGFGGLFSAGYGFDDAEIVGGVFLKKMRTRQETST